jgi:hypothetical protein
MKTARERAVKELTGVWLDADYADTEIHPGHAEDLICTIESAGLRIVDASLFQALVEAVRARQWTEACRGKWRESFLALLSDEDYLGDEIDRSGDVAEAAHARAVELLERGE